MQLRDAHSTMIMKHSNIIQKEISRTQEKVIETHYFDNWRLAQSGPAFVARIDFLVRLVIELQNHLIELHLHDRENLLKKFEPCIADINAAKSSIRHSTPEEFKSMMSTLLKIRVPLMKIVGDEIKYHEQRFQNNSAEQNQSAHASEPSLPKNWGLSPKK